MPKHKQQFWIEVPPLPDWAARAKAALGGFLPASPISSPSWHVEGETADDIAFSDEDYFSQEARQDAEGETDDDFHESKNDIRTASPSTSPPPFPAPPQRPPTPLTASRDGPQLAPRDLIIRDRIWERRMQILTVRQAFFKSSPFAKRRERNYFKTITTCLALTPDLFSATEYDAFGGAAVHAAYAYTSNPRIRDSLRAWACVEVGWASELARKYYILYDEWIRWSLETTCFVYPRHDAFSVPRRLWPINLPLGVAGTLYPFMLEKGVGYAALSNPRLENDHPPIDKLLRHYPAVMLRANQRLRGAEECVLSARL
ncbi:hypothetical protein CspHIS471_0406160 [Cutaneotrichosporon sp. HIS471]|nr:hypothetical protein CspHIS471_0406160 [Cutaneotrichosporon sp. HIS471]